DKDAVLPLALDGRLFRPGLVDAAADDLDRLLDRLAAASLGRDRTKAHRPGAVAVDLDGHLGIELGERLPRVLEAVLVADREDDRVTFDVEPGIADLGVAQGIAHAVDNSVEMVALRRRDIDFQQEIGAAAQVEAERHLLVRDLFWHKGQLLWGEQVWQAQ